MIPTPCSFHKVRYNKEEKNLLPKCGHLPPQQDIDKQLHLYVLHPILSLFDVLLPECH